MSVTWSYGVTTIAKRISSGLLDRTLSSLAKGGFPEPHLFIDGLPSDLLGESITKLRMTCHNPVIRVYGNFHLGLSELFIRDPQADLYAMFQDDLVTYSHLREYLESCEYPAKGYLNLYTFKENHNPEKEGWYLSNQLGKGAVALVFSNDVVRLLLNSPRWIGRPASDPQNKDRVWKFIDGGIVRALHEQGCKEYVHNPSLVQHTGEKSTLGNARHPLSPSFKGEEFDALSLVKARVAPVKREGRIGLVGYSAASGLGEVNRQVAEYADVYRWLIKPHSVFPTLEPTVDVDYITCPIGAKVEEFVKSVDTVVFAEVPYYNNLLDLCIKYKVRTVCIPMIEWMPVDVSGWPRKVDLFICPTKQCYNLLKDSLPCVHFSWPVDTARFQFKQRTICNKFLFINGHGGWKGRKGAQVVQAVLGKWPEMPITIYDQSKAEWSVTVSKAPESNSDLYSEGDVLISPHSVDGIGLEAMEAMASGLPVINTEGQPWNEFPSLARVSSVVEERIVRRPMDWHLPDPEHLLQICQAWLGKDISQQSSSGRQWTEDNSWQVRANTFNNLVRTGRPTEIPIPIPIRAKVVTKLSLRPVNVKPAAKERSQSRWDKFLFGETLLALKKIEGSVIVELGAIRDTKPVAKRSDGWSTVYWAGSGLEVHCVDTDEKAIAASKQLISNGVHYHLGDGFEFLRTFNGKIDLLYLDGPDANAGGQEFHLKALQVAPFSDKCLLLMDDCDLWPERWKGRGKGELAIPKALEMGFEVIQDNGRQILLQRNKDARPTI